MHVISDSCVACGTCSEACPAGAIAMDDNLGRYAISGACVDCGEEGDQGARSARGIFSRLASSEK